MVSLLDVVCVSIVLSSGSGLEHVDGCSLVVMLGGLGGGTGLWTSGVDWTIDCHKVILDMFNGWCCLWSYNCAMYWCWGSWNGATNWHFWSCNMATDQFCLLTMSCNGLMCCLCCCLLYVFLWLMVLWWNWSCNGCVCIDCANVLACVVISFPSYH